MIRIRTFAEITANIAIIVVAGLLCWTIFSAHKKPPANPDTKTSIIGTTLPEIPGHKWGDSHSAILLLAIRKGCAYCEASLPFYRRLSNLQESNLLKVRLLAVMPDNRQMGAEFLSKENLVIEAAFDQSLQSLKVSGTPTLLLLASDGRVEQAWVGKLDAEGERQVLATVGK